MNMVMVCMMLQVLLVLFLVSYPGSSYLLDRPQLGVTALANAIPDMRAMSSVNLLKNSIGVEQARTLVIILKEHPTLKSLCGNSGEETELDMSGKGMDAGDAIMLVPEIVDNRALLSLNISDNMLCGIRVSPTGTKFGTYNAAGNSDIIDLNATYSYCV